MRLHVLSACVALATSASSAYAHHVSGPPPRQGGELDGDGVALRVDASAASVELAEHDSVMFMTLAADALLRLGQRVTLGARVPTHIVSGETVDSGAGDLALRAGYDVVRRPKWRLSTRVALQLPTGDKERGMGYGTAALLPELRASLWLGEVVLVHAQSGFVADLGSAGVDPVDRRTGSEVRGALGASVLGPHGLTATAELWAGLPTSGQGTLVLASPSVSIRVGDSMQIGAYAEVPVIKERAFDWRAGVAWTYDWGRSESTAMLGSQSIARARGTSPLPAAPSAHQ